MVFICWIFSTRCTISSFMGFTSCSVFRFLRVLCSLLVGNYRQLKILLWVSVSMRVLGFLLTIVFFVMGLVVGEMVLCSR